MMKRDRFVIVGYFGVVSSMVAACGGPHTEISNAVPSVVERPRFPAGAPSIDWFERVDVEKSGLELDAASSYASRGPAIGMSTADVDDDGTLDILVVGLGRRPHLFRNEGDLSFVDVTAGSGLDDAGGAKGCALADITGDGLVDAVLVGARKLDLYPGTGPFRFGDRIRLAGPDDLGSAHGILLSDFDQSGTIDILTVGWQTPDDDPTKPANRLLLNRGIRFDAHPGPAAAFTWVAASLDVDANGVADLFVGNDTFVTDDGVTTRDPPFEPLYPDTLYLGSGVDGDLAFVDAGERVGVSDKRSTMGALVGDLNGDSMLDLYLSDYGENDALIRNVDGTFVDQTKSMGLGATRRDDEECNAVDADDDHCLLVSWGAALEDFDLDGYNDLIVVNGLIGESDMRQQPAAVWRGAPNAGYEPVDSGLDWMNGRSLIPADFDGDGDLDLLVSGWDIPIRLFENHVPAGRWLTVDIVSSGGDAEVLGVVVQLELSDGRTLVRPVGSGGVVHSWLASRVHFGLGSSTIRRLTVRRRSGQTQDFVVPGANRLVKLSLD